MAATAAHDSRDPHDARVTLVIRGARVLEAPDSPARPPVQDIHIAGDRIVALAAAGSALPPTARVIDAAGLLATPGLVSAHYHSHDTLLKGCFEQLPLEAWFLHATPPNYPKRSREEIRARVLIGALEALKSGITTVQDMATVFPFDPDHVDAILEAYDEIGLRAVFAIQVADAAGTRGMPFWDEVIPAALRAKVGGSVKSFATSDALLAVLEGELDRHAGRHPRVTWGLGPSTPEACSEAFLQGVAQLSRARGLPVFTHVYESKANVVVARRSFDRDGGSLIRHLERMGLLNERLCIAHGVWLTADEIDRMAGARASVALNPVCNLKSRSGVAPIGTYARAGVPIALGTDNSSCSDVQNMLQSMKLFTLLAATADPSGAAPTARDAFAAATLGSARAVGLEGTVGRIAPGYKADLVLFSLADPAFVPLNDAVRQLVLTEPGRSIRTVVVDGRVVLENGRCASIDEDALYAEIERLMPVLERDLAQVREHNAALMPYIAEAHRRTLALDVGLDRFVAGTPGTLTGIAA